MSAETPALKLPTSLTVYLLVYLILVIAYTPQTAINPRQPGRAAPNREKITKRQRFHITKGKMSSKT